jgi:hypothetical protein
MNSPAEKTKIFEEIDLIPEDKLSEIYDLLHHFRLGLEAAKNRDKSVMQFAGSWQDMPDEVFTAFAQDIAKRRKRAFSRRRSSESGTD